MSGDLVFYRLKGATNKSSRNAIRSRARNCVDLSRTEARPGETPKFILDHTEARSEFRQTTPVAPTGAANSAAIGSIYGHTDAYPESVVSPPQETQSVKLTDADSSRS